MKDEERAGKLINKIKNDYVFRAFVFSALSFFATAVFTFYNAFLGIAYKSIWNIGIAVYYALLLCIRAYVIFSERAFYKKKLPYDQKETARKRLFLVQSAFLFAIDLALIAPITLMVQQKKVIQYTTIPAIATAAYTTYKIIISTKNIIKTRKGRHLSVRILKTVNFVDALVSVLTLQYTLIITFGGGMDSDMFALCAVSSFGIWSLLIALSTVSLLQAVKMRKNTN